MERNDKEDKSEKIELNIIDSYHSDIGKNIARLNEKWFSILDIVEGDFICIKGKHEAIIKVYKDFLNDESKIIRLDSIARGNSGSNLDDLIEVKKIIVKDAKSIEIAPTEAVKFSSDPTNLFHEKMLDIGLIKGNIFPFNIVGTNLYYVVTKTLPKKYVKVTFQTKIKVLDEVKKSVDLKIPSITYDDIGGLKDEVSQVREMIEIPMKHPEVFERIGISAPKGVLLHGPPGTGKTLLAKALANEIDADFKVINGPEIMSKFYGESEKQLRDIFEEAEKNSPAIIFIDEIDSIAPNRDNVSGEAERRIVSQLLTLMDGLKGRGNVVVIAATNRPNAIDPALRRPGRFDREIAINPTSREGRREILDVHTRGMPLEKDVDLDKIAELTHGFTGADLEVLTKEAAFKALKKYFPDLVKYEQTVPVNILETIRINKNHFDEALLKVEPSALREVLIKKPNVKWNQIGGLNDAKRDLKEMVEMPLKEPEVFLEAGITASKGILLSGPSGTGKTLLAKAVATESEANFISIKGPELISKWVGESEKAIREIFKKARQVAPCVIFFDEFDSIAQKRGSISNSSNDKIVNQLLTEIDGIEKLTGISIIGATNRIDLIDEALLRPGRFDSIIKIDLPDEITRFEIFKIHTKNMPISNKVNLKILSKNSKGFSGAKIEGVCKIAGLNAIRNRKDKSKKLQITMTMFEDAIIKLKQRD